MFKLSQGHTRTSLQDLLGPGGATAAAAILKQRASLEQLRAAAQDGDKIGIEIAPNLYAKVSSQLSCGVALRC